MPQGSSLDAVKVRLSFKYLPVKAGWVSYMGTCESLWWVLPLGRLFFAPMKWAPTSEQETLIEARGRLVT